MPRASLQSNQSTPTPSLAEPLLTTTEAADLLSVKKNWIYEAVRDGTLPCLRIGRHIRFTRPMLEEWLLSRAEGAPRRRA